MILLDLDSAIGDKGNVQTETQELRRNVVFSCLKYELPSVPAP